MNSWFPLFRRLWDSPVVWSWAFNGLRLSFGILLLPLLLRLPAADFGFYYVLLSLAVLVPLLDMGFLTSIDRAIGYAMSGATELKSVGLNASNPAQSGPNFDLLWKLLRATQSLYRWLSVGVFILLGAWGTYVVSLRVVETSDPQMTWFAWGLTLAGGIFEMYSGWWNVYLRGINKVLLCSRILVLSFALKFLISSGLLLAGGGLLSVPLAGFMSSFIQRMLSKRAVLRYLSVNPGPKISSEETRGLIRTLWPNSWRVGCYYLAGYLTTNFNSFLCFKFLGLAASAHYGLSLQIASICSAMSGVWIQVKWPVVFQMRAKNDLVSLQRLIRPRFWLMLITFMLLGVLAMMFGRPLLQLLSTSNPKQLLPEPWFISILVYSLLELHLTFWATIIITENRLPFLWPTVATNLASLASTLCLLQFTSLGVGSLILAPLVSGIAFNYWYWAIIGANGIQTTYREFLFQQPSVGGRTRRDR